MKEIVGFDVETTGKDATTCEIVSAQVYHPDNEKVDVYLFKENSIFPVYDPHGLLMELAEKYEVIGHHLYFDLLVCSRYGARFVPAGDSFLAFCMSPMAITHPKLERGLKDLSVSVLNTPMISFEQVCLSGNFGDCDFSDPFVREYMEQDPRQAYLLYKFLISKYPHIMKGHKDEMAVMPFLVEMTKRGLKIDKEELEKVIPGMKSELSLLERELWEGAGVEFRPNSGADLAKVLSKMGLEVIEKRTKAGVRSYDKDVLESVLPNPFMEKVIRCRELIYQIPRMDSILNKFVVNGRLHPFYNQVGWTGSGRVYTEKPATNSLSTAARKAVIPESGYKFVYVDWKSAELILAAQEAEESNITGPYFAGEDVFRNLAASLYGCTVEEVSIDEREVTKIVQYAALYGSEGAAVSAALKAPFSVGANWVEKFWQANPRLTTLRDKVHKQAKVSGQTETITGFIRHIPISNVMLDEAQRKAFNTRFQSGVACLFKKALIKLNEIMPKSWFVVTGVYDSFLLEVPIDVSIEEVSKIIGEVSKFDIDGKKIEFRFSISYGFNWAEAQGK